MKLDALRGWDRRAVRNALASAFGWRARQPAKTRAGRFGMNTMRMAYSTDFSTAGRLKRKDGSLRAIMRHNNRIPRPELESEAEPRLEGAVLESIEGGTPKRSTVWRGQGAHRWKENIDPARIQRDQIWLNPLYGGDGAWTAPADLPEAVQTVPEAPVMAALHGLLGIDEVDGKLLYGEGKGDCGGRRRKEVASAKSKRRRKTRKAVRDDAVLAVDVILQASPSFFFPRIREEGWDQERIDKSFVWERGPLDQGAVDAFRDAGLKWAKAQWEEKRIAEVALHLDESCPHLHIIVIPESGDKLAGGSVVPGPAEARKMLDNAAPFFANLHAGMSLERPEEGGQSTGQTYSKRNRVARKEAEEAERRRDEAQREAEVAETEAAERKARVEAESAERVKVAVQIAEKAEAEVFDLESRKDALERDVRRAEARKASLEVEAQRAEMRKEVAEVELADRTARLDRREERLQKWTDACQQTAREMDAIQDDLDQRQADQQVVQEAGDEAVARLREILRQEPTCRPTVAVRRVAESYRAEAVQECRRADEAEQALAEAQDAMGPFAELLRLPALVARTLWTGLVRLLDERVPGWLQVMRKRERELLDEDQRRQEAEIAKNVVNLEAQLDSENIPR